jgi:hypothetical protein
MPLRAPKNTTSAGGPLFPTRVCRASVDRAGTHDDGRAAEQREKLLLDRLTGVAVRLWQERATKLVNGAEIPG